uniref:B9 domain-containing protein 1 n=2 Tax=Tetraselmis sp. GSL018 TaxID=582737 RepID=A0A061SHH3_9CHLO|mmetsp:Transcript_26691/g.63263  ORF Transcript_26691/g.63263 Transcript_26691/m.63263 type:complete len:196 (-) Transcript_26691:121-708(-)|eukprot:CAMPEP_0177618898 /NCGR_PEP_ID=MMETSP0419_2-20121207/25904_1 /TAXON_ID=582737 /ORGANISM="Tetraselmis sp., Strain GSL018" /LENGTH=195 /DNA_ID=CAMNT_0019117993 /DNA_START=287 /DNA_END=874 /DNA_ORIENTATION=-
MAQHPTSFTVMITGQIESAEVPDCENAYCKYQVVHGEDWKFLDGQEDGMTQASRRSQGPDDSFVWNFPLDLTYNSTNVFGWPQIIVTVFSTAGGGAVMGYGCVHFPTCPGRYTQKLRLFRPQSSTIQQAILNTLRGTTPEFSDPKFPSYGSGREVTRVTSCGHCVVKCQVLTKDMEECGYDVGSAARTDSGMFTL